MRGRTTLLVSSVILLCVASGIAIRARGTAQEPVANEPKSDDERARLLATTARSFSSRGAPAATTRPATSRSRPASH